MSISILTYKNVVSLGVDEENNAKGFLEHFQNQTGEVSRIGTVVSPCSTSCLAVVKHNGGINAVGVIGQSGFPIGEDVWIWVDGSVCPVLYEDGKSATFGNSLLLSEVAGRVYDVAVADVKQKDFLKVIGRVMQTKPAGVDMSALVKIHFN